MKVLREPIEGSVTLSFTPQCGGGKLRSHKLRCSGTFEPTVIMKNDLPVYVKKGDPDVKLEHNSGKRWDIRAPLVKNAASLINIVARCDLSRDQLLPIQAASAGTSWKFNMPEYVFEPCSELVVTASSKAFLPANVHDLLSESNKSVS